MIIRGEDSDALEMVEERLAYGLALYPPPEIQQQLRRDLDARDIPYPHRFHVTLKYAFIPTNGSGRSVADLASLVGAYPHLLMRSNGRLASEATLCHLLLIEQDPTLMRLHRELGALLCPAGRLLSPDTGRFEGAGYNPHITIAYGSSVDEFRRFTARLDGYEPQFEFEVQSVELSCFEPGRPDPIRAAAQVFPLGQMRERHPWRHGAGG